MKKLLFLLLLMPLTVLGQQENSAFAKAQKLFNNASYAEAKPIFDNHLKQYPDDIKTLEYLGDIAGYSKKWDTAIGYYEQLVDLQPKNANFHFKYGGVLGMKALEINRLRALTLLGDIKEAFLTAAALDPNHLEVRWALIELYIQLPALVGGSEEKALYYANELAHLSPVDGHLANGYIAEYNDRPQDAERYYIEAVNVGGSVTCYTKLYEHYESNNEPQKAIQTLEEAQQKHKNNNRLHYQLGKIAGQYGIGLDQGIGCLQRYIKNHSAADGVPKDWAYLRLAQIYRHKGNKAMAITWIEKALEDRPNFKEAIKEKEMIQAL